MSGQEMRKEKLQIMVDSREQRPYTFERFKWVEVSRGTLSVGDYSFPAYQDRVSIERKSIDDMIQCLSRERDRFERELSRAAALECFYVVIESGIGPVVKGMYRSRMTVNSVIQSVAALSIRYNTPFLWCDSREAAEVMTHALLRQFWRQQAAGNSIKRRAKT
jgi:DNA excision repair protein ERCC-4